MTARVDEVVLGTDAGIELVVVVGGDGVVDVDVVVMAGESLQPAANTATVKRAVQL